MNFRARSSSAWPSPGHWQTTPLSSWRDEPTANLDLKTGEDIIALMKELSHENNVTVITATLDHKMLAASDRIVWIKDGGVDKIQTAAEANIKVGTID